MRNLAVTATMGIASAIGIGVLIGSAPAISLADPATRASVTPDPPRIAGRHAPPPPIQTLAPRELWRVTDGDEETGNILGRILDAAVDAAGNTYLLDAGFTTVRVFDPAGKSLGTLGRAGEGPGEFSNPRGCLALADGRVGVTQFLPARIVTFGRDGNPAADITPPQAGSFEILEAAQAAAGALYLSTHCMLTTGDAPRSVMRLRSLALDGSLRTLFKEVSHSAGKDGVFTTSDSEGNDFTRHWAAGPDGRVYVAQRYGAYEIEVFAPDGTLERVIALEYEHVRQTAAEKEAPESQGAAGRGRARTGSGGANPVLRDIDALHPRPDGTLWVASSRAVRDRPAGTVGAFDVFDREGRFTGRIALAADYVPEVDEFVLAGSRLYVLKEARMAPVTAATVGGGVASVHVESPSARDRGEPEPKPYAVICYELGGS